jgi:hypothetical protein
MFGKKRGHRRTGSKVLASAGEALFFVILLGTGAGFFVLMLAKMVVPEWRAEHDFIETTATVLETRIDESSDNDGRRVYRPAVHIRYSVAGQPYDVWTYDVTRAYSSGREDKQAAIDRLEVGHEYLCWYDPLNPARSVLVRGYSWWFWPLALVPIGFMLIGGVGLAYTLWQWGKSPEHQAARGQLGRVDLLEELHAAERDFPTVPFDADLTNSPGTSLKYRLPVSTSAGWRLLAATTICLLWNGIVATFIVVAIRRHLNGQHDWGLDLFILPFAAAGGYLIYFFVRELLIATGIGPTLLEISDHPLWPGKTYELHITQGGHLTVNSLDISLRCEERATYRQGTDTRSDRRLVFRQSVLHREGFAISAGQPFSVRCELHVPAAAMHSFKADHNEVQWTLVVETIAAGWPSFQRVFPVVVYPPERATHDMSLTVERVPHATAVDGSP